MKLLATLIVFCTAIGIDMAAQPQTTTPPPAISKGITEKQAREMATTAASGGVSETLFQTYFEDLVYRGVHDYNDGLAAQFVYVVKSDDLVIYALAPLAAFEISVSERIRKREPVGDAVWNPGVSVTVSPRTINARDIEKIVVERDGKVIEPIVNMLQESELQTRMGAKRMIHRGFVMYPTSAFEPGADVTIIAIPTSGKNYELRLDDALLRRII